MMKECTSQEIEEKSSFSAFLWKAATSTINTHPTIVANLMLRCKKALNDTKVGVKFRKVSRTNICQSCGNPWSFGNYNLQIKKTAKIKTIKRMRKHPKERGLFQKHILDRYSKSPSSITIKCGNCSKLTAFPAPLPPRESKKNIKLSISSSAENNHHNHTNNQSKKQLAKQKRKENHQKVPSIQVPIKGLSKVIKQPAAKKQISKTQLKNISKTLKQNPSKPTSSLQSFLNSVK